MRTKLYFAYGSNLCLTRIRMRAPSATPFSVGCLHGYQLIFNKKGIDGSGKCTISFTGLEEDQVFGVLYLLDVEDKSQLDVLEGKGFGYREGVVDVLTPNGPVEASTYIASDAHVDRSLQPFDWYLEYVVAGAREHRLPEYYISTLETIHAVKDPDLDRSAVNRTIIWG